MITVNSYFSGAGLFDIGLVLSGLKLQQSFEIDEVCCQTQRRNFSHEVIQTDITQKLVFNEKECDVMVATYPCTKYSVGHNITTKINELLISHMPLGI